MSEGLNQRTITTLEGAWYKNSWLRTTVTVVQKCRH